MIKRPKPGEDEEDLLRMQEEYLKEKEQNKDFQSAAQVVKLTPQKRPISSEDSKRKPSKYALSKGLVKDKKIRFADYLLVGDIVEKNVDQNESTETKVIEDKVYYPSVIPSLLGNIVEKNIECYPEYEAEMPSKGFPEINTKIFKNITKEQKMDIDEATPVKLIPNTLNNLPNKSYIVSSEDAQAIHNENSGILNKMSEQEIIEERQKLMSSLNPQLIEFLQSKRKKDSIDGDTKQIENVPFKVNNHNEDKIVDKDIEKLNDCDIFSHPDINNWLHFESLEKDKLEWMKGITENNQINPDQPYEARFDFKGYLQPYTGEYTEKTKTLYHHGSEPHRPGYTLNELFELSRSTIPQQRVMALNTIAGLVEYLTVGTYKDVIDIPLSKILFVVRIAMDENKSLLLEPALKAMRNILYNKADEASLDALVGSQFSCQQPSLENDKKEIQELDAKETDLKDFHLAEIDIVAATLRTDILQRIYYILNVVKPSFNSVQYCLQILTRLSRDSVDTTKTIVSFNNLMNIIITNFVPSTSLNFFFDPLVYNGKPVLSALKLLRVVTLQHKDINDMLVNQGILKPIAEYISSSVDSTHGLKMQMESYCILSNLLSFNMGVETAQSVLPVVMTTLFKHVQGTNMFESSILSTTHAAVVLQCINKMLQKCPDINKYESQLKPLLIEGFTKWCSQLSSTSDYNSSHLKVLGAIFDCFSTILSFGCHLSQLNNILVILAKSKGYLLLIKELDNRSNLLSKLQNNDLFYMSNLVQLNSVVIESAEKVLPILTNKSPFNFLCSLFNLLDRIKESDITKAFTNPIKPYLLSIEKEIPSLCENWCTRMESNLVFYVIRANLGNAHSEADKDLIYSIANKLCYITRSDQNDHLKFLFENIIFDKHWFTAQRVMNTITLTEDENIRILNSINDIKACYAANLKYGQEEQKFTVSKWRDPILPRDWIYLPILKLYSKSQDQEIVSEKAKDYILSCSLEWILFIETCFPDLLHDITLTDRFCRLMCVYLCDSTLFLDKHINMLLKRCILNIFAKEKVQPFNFDQEIMGLSNFQDFYTQFLEQFQSVSYGDHTFAACVLAPLAQRHNSKWRKLLWSEYAGCLRALDCPEELLCYSMNEYLTPEEADESIIKSYVQALNSNLLRTHTISHMIASHHVQKYKERIGK